MPYAFIRDRSSDLYVGTGVVEMFCPYIGYGNKKGKTQQKGW
jgi:hypothetical protein